jgi:hypothetical protein
METSECSLKNATYQFLVLYSVFCAPMKFNQVSKSKQDQRRFLDTEGAVWVFSPGRNDLRCSTKNCPAIARTNSQMREENTCCGIHIIVGHINHKMQAVDKRNILFGKVDVKLSETEESITKIEDVACQEIFREALGYANIRIKGIENVELIGCFKLPGKLRK